MEWHPPPIWDTGEAGLIEEKETAHVGCRQTSGCHTVCLRVPSKELVGGEGDKKAEQVEIQGPFSLHRG